MNVLAIFSTLFFIFSIVASVYYLSTSQRKMQINAAAQLDEDIREVDHDYLENWLKQGKTVHPIKYVYGGISSFEVKRLQKGITPIRHTIMKLSN